MTRNYKAMLIKTAPDLDNMVHDINSSQAGSMTNTARDWTGVPFKDSNAIDYKKAAGRRNS